MKNFKIKIRTLLTALIIAALCSSLFVTDISYAKPAKATKPAEPTKEDTTGGAAFDSGALDALEAKQKAEEEAAKEAECQYKYGTSCAQNKLDEDPNSLVEGTFSVTDNLKLDNGEQPKKYFNDNSGESPIVSFILTIINFATTVMGSFAVILFIVAGFMFMVSGGNSQKLDEAKDIVKYAAIGLIVAFMAYVITIFVQSIFSNG